ncbi:DUF4282 domain-containing protein [Thiocapsa imhoffii]|nr:DUF4282 domain-containing protein [Thiocapsa imhoffii]
MDLLTFETLISIPVLIAFYYLGAVVMPVGAWILSLILIRRVALARQAAETGLELFKTALPWRWRLLMILLFGGLFLFMELMWRLMFEYLIAFMQIRDALVAH